MKVVKTDDRQLRAEILQSLKESDGYCPCKLERNSDTKCMCKEFRDQIKAGIPGTCHCGLYQIVSEDKNEN